MRITLSEFLQAFPTPPLHHTEPQSDFTPWVFWSRSENSSSSAIHEKIISSFSTMKMKRMVSYICQFWAPVTIGGKRLLSTSDQPFAVGYLSNEFAMYRKYYEDYKCNMDVDNHICGAFVNRLSCVNQLQWVSSEVDTGLNVSVMLPLCLGLSYPCTCIGVLEFTADANLVAEVVLEVIVNLKKAGLDVFPVQDIIPYKTINGLKLVKDEIDNALKVVCRSHNLSLAQVWIACEDTSYVPSSYCMKETREKQLLALKLTGCVFDVTKHGYTILHTLCDAIPSILALSTLEDYSSRFVTNLCSDFLIGLDGTFLPESSAATICLKSNDTGDVDYAFEFIWTKDLNFPACLLGVLSTLKKCLPRFKFASGKEIDEASFITFVGKTTSKGSLSQRMRIVPRKRSSPIPKEGHKEAEDNLHGFKISRKIRKANDSSIIQIKTNEKDTGAIQGPSTDNLSENTLTLTLEVDYGYGMIKFHLPVSQATYANVVNEISKKLGLSVGTYDLQYLDEEKDWICVDREEEMGICISSSRIRASTEEQMGDGIKSLRIQLRVLLSQKSVIGPFGVLSI